MDRITGFRTFVDVLRRRAEEKPGQPALTFLREGEVAENAITFAQLDCQARAVASFLQENGKQGERALLLLPSGPEFVSTFFGCLYAGVIAIPAFPVHFGRPNRGLSWLKSIVADARPTLAFGRREMLHQPDPDLAAIQWCSLRSVDLSLAESWHEPNLSQDALAFLQYTSGSTSSPKGVMVSHHNLLNNMSVIQSACKISEGSTVVTWLPLFHDMGLIGTVLQPLYMGGHSFMMTPTAFLQKPVRWLQAISRYRAHSSSAPNFAYELCARKILPEEKIGLDLSEWRTAVNGSEPVQPETMERFVSAFHEYGFRAETFYPSYGLAESTLMAAGGRLTPLPSTMRLSSAALERNAVREPTGDEPARVIVGCGSAQCGQELRIVDPETSEHCAAGTIGEIWVSGPSVAQGYWNRPEETEAVFGAQLATGEEGEFLRTGDLGFISEGQLFVTGRLKDLIILRGRNLYPLDLELTMQKCHPSLRSGCGAAFTIEIESRDLLILVNEVERHPLASTSELISAIREAILQEHGIHTYSIVLLKAGTLPRTTSGKIKRNACRNVFLSGELSVVASQIFSFAGLDSAFTGDQVTRTDILRADPELRYELIESRLQQQVAKLVGISPDDVDLDKPLISTGLDSLGAFEFANLVEAGTGVKLNPVNLLDGCSICQLAARILEQMVDTVQGVPPRKHLGNRESFPLSWGQQGLWVLNRVSPHSMAYTLASAVRTKTSLDVIALRQALLQVMNRHEMLRAVFSTAEGMPVQTIQRLEDLDLDRHFQSVDLSRLESSEVLDRLRDEVQRPFFLEEMPPIRLLVFHLSSEEDVMMLALHHIIADLWSVGILLQELGAVYAAHRTRKLAALPELESSYLDFVQWQFEKIRGSDGEILLNYWRSRMFGNLPALQLATDRPRPLMPSSDGATEPLHFAPDLYRRIQKIGRAESVTPFMFLVAAFQVLLHRASGQEDVLLGTPINGRSKAGFAQVVGYFTNPVVLRSYYDGFLTFASYLTEARRQILDAFQHQDYPFPLLVEHLHPRREGGLPPIFQVMFVWQELRGTMGNSLAALSTGNTHMPFEFGDVSVEPVPIGKAGSQFDVTLLMSASGTNLLGTLKYSTALFDQTTIMRLGNQFSILLEALADNMQHPLAALPLVSGPEREQLLQQCTTTRRPQASNDTLIHELFEKQVENSPTDLVLIAGEKRLTFKQLNAQANQFARYLRSLGVGTEVLVGVCLSRSAEIIAAILGIWKAGGVYMPLDARDPETRLAAIVEQTSLGALITHGDLLDRLPPELPPVVLLDLDSDAIAQQDNTNLGLAVDDRSLAYVIYTSGSTGKPKGVMIEHRSLMNLFSGLAGSIYATHGDRLIVGLNAPFTFDSSMKQIVTLAMGHTLCLVPEDIRRNGDQLLRFVQEQRLDALDCTPTQLQLLLEAGLAGSVETVMLLVGGEHIPKAMWETLSGRKLKPCYNLYGPTECTVDATVCRIGSEPEVSLGKALPGVNVYLLDAYVEPVPIGVSGEIFIGGDGVGRGYLSQPDLTAERFIPDPFSALPGSRMYRTGDRARWSANYTIQFIGRIDRQVKIRGFRIELGEIEAALCAHEGVQNAAVLLRNTFETDKQLIAYVVALAERPSNHYRQFLAKKIPDYMIPAVVVSVPNIPTNTHGKRDYNALPIPVMAQIERFDDYTPPQSPMEQYLANLWTAVLHVEPIGIHDNFFSLGGDSLQATRLINQIQEEHSSDMPLLALFFQEPTIASLAKFIERSEEISNRQPSTRLGRT